MSGAVSHQRYAEHEHEHEHEHDASACHSRVTPVMPAPKWLRDFDKVAETSTTPLDMDESQFWETPPRYSVTNLVSLSPAPVPRTSSRWHTWSARLLFATIACAVVALLVLELRSLGRRVPLTSLRALSVLLSPSP